MHLSTEDLTTILQWAEIAETIAPLTEKELVLKRTLQKTRGRERKTIAGLPGSRSVAQ